MNTIDADGQSPLIYIAMIPNMEMLVEAGADVNLRSLLGEAALLRSTYHGHIMLLNCWLTKELI